MESSYKINGDFSMIVKTKGIGYVIEGFKDIKNRKIFYRTSGLDRICGLDLEINLSLDPTEARRILDCIVEVISDGFELSDGLITSDLTNAPVLVQEREAKYPNKENEKCYRIIFSDEKFLLPTNKKCNMIYKSQME